MYNAVGNWILFQFTAAGGLAIWMQPVPHKRNALAMRAAWTLAASVIRWDEARQHIRLVRSMNSVGGQLDFGETAFDGLAFMDGERVETTLNLLGETEYPKDGDVSKAPRRKWGKNPADAHTNLLVLTDRRLIHLVYNASERKSAFVSLSAVSAVRMDARRPGRAAGFVWGGISLLTAALLWAVWAQPVLDVVAAGVVALMGLYIMLDYVMAPHAVQMTISAGLSQMTMGVHGSISTQRMNDFANRVFEAKANEQYPGVGRWPLDTAGADDIYGRGEGTPGASHAYGQEEAPDDTPRVEGVASSGDPPRVEGVVVPDDTLRVEGVVVPDDTLRVEDVVVPDDTRRVEGVAVPDDTRPVEDVASSDDPPQVEGVASLGDTPQVEGVAASGDTPQVEGVVASGDTPQVEGVASSGDTPQREDVATPDGSSEPLGSDRAESGESLVNRGGDSSPAGGSSGQS